MPSLQIRNFSEDAYKKLAERAKADRRSIQQEAAWLLEAALQAGAYSPFFTAPLRFSDWSLADKIRQDTQERHGVQPDSTPMIREMRDER